MARAVWTGSLSFGLVNVPVALFSATEERSIRFSQLQAGTADRVRNRRVNERTGEEVPYRDIVKGYDLGAGEYVVLTPEEIASVAPGRSKTIDVSAFVDLSEIDPVYFDRPYYLAPSSKEAGTGAERAYTLLRDAMLRADKVALATLVLREKQYLVAIRPRDDVLVLETLLYADEVRDPLQEIDTLPVHAAYQPQELEMAQMLIDSMSTSWEPHQFHDAYRERLEALIEQRREGQTIAVQPPEPQAAPVIDLLAALEASVRSARGVPGRADRAAGTHAARRRGQPSRSPAPTAGERFGRATARTPRPVKGGAKAASGAGDLAGATKPELARQAAELGIPGRSKMSRDQLEAAVRGASTRRPRKVS